MSTSTLGEEVTTTTTYMEVDDEQPQLHQLSSLVDDDDDVVDEEGNVSGTTTTTMTLTMDGTTQMLLNEETGEVEIIDMGDGDNLMSSQEVEVVTVDNPGGGGGSNEGNFSTNGGDGDGGGNIVQIINSQRRLAASSMSIRNKLVTRSVGSSSSVLMGHSSSGSGLQSRIAKPPALLRNSRRFHTVESSSSMSDMGTTAASLYGNSTRLVANSGSSSISGRGSFGNSIGGEGSGSGLQLEMSDDNGSLQSQGYQQAVILDDNGQPTDEIVLLAPNDAGEFQVVERSGGRDFLQSQEYYSTSTTATSVSSEKGDGNTFQHQGQTIIICQDEEGNQMQGSQFVEDEEGNIISIDGSALAYQFSDNNTMYSVDMGEVGVFDVPSTTGSIKKTKKRSKKPLQVLIGPDGKPVKKKGQTELQCMEKGCQTICYNVFELRKHLTVTHSIHFDEEIVEFQEEKEFKEWRENYERERMVSFIYRGGTKKIAKDQAVTYMICHRSGHYKPTMRDESLRKRKLKPQGSCKMGGYCTAGIKLLKNLDNGTIKMEICHTHYGHPLDSDAIPHLRVNPTLRKVILAKFREGLSFTEVLAYIHHNPDRLEGLRLVDRRAVRNIFDAWKNPNKRSKKAQLDIDEIMNPEILSTEGFETEMMDNSSTPITSHADAETSGFISVESHGSETKKTLNAPTLQNATHEKDVSESTDEENSTSPSTPPLMRKIKTRSKSVKTSPKVSTKEDPLFTKEVKSGSDSDAAPTVDLSIVKVDLNDSSEHKGYRLRPNRRVEVYKSTKPKRSASPTKFAINNSQPEPAPPVLDTVETGELHPRILKTGPPPLKVVPVTVSENLELAINKLHNHGESGPTVLFYKKSGKPAASIGAAKRELRKEDFCVILQTPVQRQLLQMFPDIIGLEVLESPRSQGHLNLAFLMVLDEYREAIPVAWLVANSVLPRMILNFFRVVKDECGELRSDFLMTSKALGAHKMWCSIFGKKPKLLLNDADFRRDLKALINQDFGNDRTRREVWDIVETLINEPQKQEVEKFLNHTGSIYENLKVLTDDFPVFKKKFADEWLSTIKEWALCYRLDTPINVVGVFNSFNRLKKFVSFKGTKNLHESFDHILKIGYDKCFLRSKRMFKGDQKFSQFMDDIKARHCKSRNLLNPVILQTEGQSVYSVKVEEVNHDFKVTYAGISCDCRLKCKQCKVCAHMYLCTCRDYVSTQVMCEHIHLVHCSSNNIEDEPEFISGDINALQDGSEVFGRIKTVGSGESPGQIINIEAVLKAAGLFHRSDGLQPEQIVSITDADTHAVIYEHKL